jgi:hypothetical protein
MKPIDKLLFGLFFGFSFPLLFSMCSFILWYYFFQVIHPLYLIFIGFIAGIFTDIIYLKKLINLTPDLPTWILIGFYLFYNIFIYGLFMGFPLFNLAMGVIAGYYYGIRINYKNIPLTRIKYLKIMVPLFTGIIMLLICISTALLALSEKTIGLELQNILGLSFQVTGGMIISIILIGGLSLIVTQYFLTKIVMTIIIKIKNIG